MQLKLPLLEDRPYRPPEVDGGRDFVFNNDANTILFRVRMANSAATILVRILRLGKGWRFHSSGCFAESFGAVKLAFSARVGCFSFHA